MQLVQNHFQISFESAFAYEFHFHEFSTDLKIKRLISIAGHFREKFWGQFQHQSRGKLREQFWDNFRDNFWTIFGTIFGTISGTILRTIAEAILGTIWRTIFRTISRTIVGKFQQQCLGKLGEKMGQFGEQFLGQFE